MSRAQKFWNEHAEWSQKTFGKDSERGPMGPLKHLEKEAKEAQAALQRIEDGYTEEKYFEFGEEVADCLLLVFDAARRSGDTLETLIDRAFRKLEINKMRKWETPYGANEAVEHIRN